VKKPLCLRRHGFHATLVAIGPRAAHIRAPSVDAPSEADFARADQSPPEESIIRISKDEAWDE
jgi:hypothetical protein